MSTIRADYISPSAGGTTKSLVRGTAAAWVNFNGTGTIATRDSENMSSLVDNGTGTYTINLNNNMATANYVGHANVDAADVIGNPNALSTSAWQMRSYYPHGTTYYDPSYGWTSIHGDLA